MELSLVVIYRGLGTLIPGKSSTSTRLQGCDHAVSLANPTVSCLRDPDRLRRGLDGALAVRGADEPDEPLPGEAT